MPSGTLQVYTALAENAAPLPGVTVLVLNEAGTQIARLTTDDVGSAPELVLTAPDEAYSLDEANTTVRPYAVYQLRAELTGFRRSNWKECRCLPGSRRWHGCNSCPPPHPARSRAGSDPGAPAVRRERRQRPGPKRPVCPYPRAERSGGAEKITVHLARPAGQRGKRDGQLPGLALPTWHPVKCTPPGRNRRCGPTFWRRSAWR